MRASFSVDLTPGRSGRSFRVDLDGRVMEVEILHAGDGNLTLLVDGQRVTAHVTSDSARCWVTANGRTLLLTKPPARANVQAGITMPPAS